MRFLLSPQGVNPHLRINGPMNINHYATKKSVAESMLDVALFMANVTQLKAVLEQGSSFQYYTTLIVLISISLFFQVIIGILLIITGKVATEAHAPLQGTAGAGHPTAWQAWGWEGRSLVPQIVPHGTNQGCGRAGDSLTWAVGRSVLLLFKVGSGLFFSLA